MQNPSKNIPVLIILGWLLLNACQSYFSELIHDESYYWVYAQNLDWGFFDQPPAVAIFIWLGSSVFDNELGVRLVFLLTNAYTLWLIWKMTDQQHPKLFFGLAFASMVAHLGFLAVPDIPLLFFVAIFFYLSRQYLEKDNWLIAITLGIVIAAMGYSKYQGIVILVFALLSNSYLIKRPSFWAMLIIGSLLFFPHLYWQWSNDYPTFRYHLYDRLSEPYSFLFPLNYCLGQLLLFGPIVGVVYAFTVWKFQPKSNFDKMLKWTVYGIFGFFLLMSFRGRIEANWTVAAFVPLLLIAYRVTSESQQLKAVVNKVVLVSIGLILLGRVYLVYDYLPEGIIARDEVHNWDEWAKNIAEVAEDRPVIFNNNYQKASKYEFYARKQAHSANRVNYAGNQYDLLYKKEAELVGKSVIHISDWINARDTVFSPPLAPSPYIENESFHFLNRLKIEYDLSDMILLPDSIYTTQAKLVNPTAETIVLPTGRYASSVSFHWFEYRKPSIFNTALTTLPVESVEPGEEVIIKLSFRTPEKPGNYRFRFAIKTDLHHGRNSAFSKLKITGGN
ncbi:MAG: glycosyltransferase family 39 protein [Bacteroidota bacterium]